MHGGFLCMAFCLSVCLAGCDWTKNQTGPKVTWPKVISQQPFNLGSWNLVITLKWMTPRLTSRIKVIGQRSRSPGQKTLRSWGQGSHGSSSYGPMSRINLERQGQQVRNVIPALIWPSYRVLEPSGDCGFVDVKFYEVDSLAVATRMSHNYQVLLDDGNRIIIPQGNFLNCFKRITSNLHIFI